MTRGWKTTLLHSILFAAFAIGTAINATGAPPPPAPSGTIYYRTGMSFNAVKPDGSGQAANLLPGIGAMTSPVFGNANPAFFKSGSNSTQDRWFIYPGNNGTYDEYITRSGSTLYDFPHRDLFAVRSNPADRSQLIVVQLTDLYGIVTFEPASAGWSNDSNDNPASFVESWAQDLSSAYSEIEDPDTGEITTRLDASLQIPCTARLPLTSSDLDAGGIIPIGPDTVTPAQLHAMLWPYMFRAARIDGQGIISPDGLDFLSINSTQGTRLEIVDATTGSAAQLLWDGTAGVPNVISRAQWSPSGTTIAIAERVSTYPGGGHIWTQPADASASPKKVLSATTSGSNKTAYSEPIWSPDNQYLVVLKQRYSGTTLTGAWITRVKVSDGKTQDLVSVPTSGDRAPLRWVSNN